MHTLLIIGGILGLLAIAGGVELAIFVVRVGVVLTIGVIAYAIYDMHQPTLAERCGKDPFQAGCGDVIPEGWVVDASPPAPVAITPAKPGPIHIPLQDLPMPVRPPPQIQGWDADNIAGPWSEAPMMPPSARADRLLRLFHQAQGVEMGQ